MWSQLRIANTPENIKFNIQWFDSLTSTNQYCELLNLDEVEEFTVIAARSQTAGIGQRGNHWESEAGKNLTFSLILKPDFLPVADQFRITEAVSLALVDTLTPLLPQADGQLRIKWPNDIYVATSKICGMLVSNKIQHNTLQASIVGIGLNVNQTSFPNWVPNPISVAQLISHEIPLEPLLTQLLTNIGERYHRLRQYLNEKEEYLSLLLNRGVESDYLYHGTRIRATLCDVNSFGHLQLVTSDGTPLSCGLKEIAFLLPPPRPWEPSCKKNLAE